MKQKDNIGVYIFTSQSWVKFIENQRKKFLPLYIIARTSSIVGDIAFYFYAVISIFKATESTFQTALLLTFAAIPHVLLGKAVSTRIDTWNPRAVAIAADVFRFLVLILFSMGSHVNILYGTVPLLALGSVFFNPAAAKMVQLAIAKKSLIRANSTIAFFENIFKIGTPAIIGSLFSFLTIKQLFLFNAVTYIVSACAILIISPQVLSLPLGRRATGAHNKRLIKINEQIISKYFISCEMLFSFFNGMNSALMPALSFKTHNLTEQEFSFLYVFAGMGLILGSYISNIIERYFSIEKGATYCLFLLGVNWALYFFSTSFLSLLAINFCAGLLISIYFVFFRTAIQKNISSFNTGSIFTIIGIVQNVFFLLGLLITGIVAETTPPPHLFLAIGCGLSLLSIANNLAFRSSLLQLVEG